MAGRILRVSTTYRRSVEKLGVRSGSPGHRALATAMRALAAGEVPGAGDYEVMFAPGRAYARRVTGQNVWILYRFDDDHVFLLTARGQPPVPVSE